MTVRRNRSDSRRKNRSRDAAADIPVASFSDIAFLLIIFFIVTTTLVQTKGVATDFPAGEENQQTEDKQLTVTIAPLAIKLDDTTVTMSQLRRKLMDRKLAEKQKPEERVVIIEAHKQVRYERYYQVLAIIHQAGGVPTIVREQEGDG